MLDLTRNGPAAPITWHPHEMTPSEISDWIRAGWVFPARYHCRIGKITLKTAA